MQLSFRQRVQLQLQLFAVKAKKGWSWDHVRRVTYSVFQDADTSTIRILLANASAVWALVVFSNPEQFNTKPFEIMRTVCDARMWSLLFAFHFIGVYWRTYDPVPRIMAGLIINSYGFLIWFFMTVSINFHVGWVSPVTALELTMCAASAWALYKTGFRQELISP